MDNLAAAILTLDELHSGAVQRLVGRQKDEERK
jgi:hypothetical protein